MTASLAPGFLVAAPPLGDPNFDRSVVLLASHGEDGAFGWIINGPDLMTLPELLVRAEVTTEDLDMEGRVRLGGPVSQEQVWILYRQRDRFDDLDAQFDVGDGITACASRTVLERIADSGPPPDLFGVVGYAGWAPGQLEDEIRAGAWLPTAPDPDVVFEAPRDDVWTRAYSLAGTTPLAFTTRTIGSA